MLKTQHIRAADAVTAGSGGRFHSSAVLGERKVPKEELNFPLQKLEQKEQIRPKGGKIQKKQEQSWRGSSVGASPRTGVQIPAS